MGTYRAPGQIIDKSYQVANQQLAAGINKYDKLFAIKKEEQKVQMEKNAKLKEKQELDRVNGYDKFNTELRRVRPAGGYVDNITPFADKLADEYASLYGKTDPASLKRMKQIMSIPTQIAEGQGAMRAIDTKYGKSLEAEQGSPNSVNYIRSNNDNLEYVINYHNNTGKIIPSEIDGQMNWGLEGRTLDNSALVNGSLEGHDFLKYHGDIADVMGGTIEGIQTAMKYQDQGKKIIDKTNPRLHKTGVSYEAANEEYKKQLSNFNYDKTLNGPGMPKIWDGLIREVEEEYARDVESGNMLTSKAGLLLYGADRKPGGEGIDADATAELGPWVGGDDKFSMASRQKEIARQGFYAYGTSDQYIKPNFVETSETKLTPKVENVVTKPVYNAAEQSKIIAGEKIYLENLKLSQEIADLYNTTDSSTQTISTTRNKGLTKLATKLNKINAQRADTKNPTPEGKFAVNNGKLVFVPNDEDAVISSPPINFKDASEINRYLSVNSKQLDDFVFDFYSNQGSGGSGGASQFNK